MNDAETCVGELKALVDEFVQERNWEQFHAPKNLVMALAVETSELMEHFQWISVEASRQIGNDPDKLAEVAEELADVVSYSLALANALKLDLSKTVEAKMVKNALKYPAEKYHGRWQLPENERGDTQESS